MVKLLSGGTNLKAGFLMGGLLGEETGGEGLLHVGRDENAAEAVFGARATMDADAGTSRDLLEDGEQALELGGLGDGDAIDERRYEMVGILEGIADVVEAFNEEAGTLVDIMGCPV